MTVVPRSVEKSERVLSFGAGSFCRYNSRNRWSRVEIFLTNTMLVYILEGEKVLHRPDSDITLGPGDGFIARKGSHVFSESFPSGGKFESLLWYLDDSWLLSILTEFELIFPSGPDQGQWIFSATPALQDLFSTTLPYFDAETTPSSILKGKLSELLWNLSRQEDGKRALAGIQAHGSLMPSVLDVLEANLTRNLLVEDLARLAGRSRASLVRDVKRLAGTSPKQWVIAKRIELAAIMLRTTSKSVTSIALESGFESLTHFETQFKRYREHTPLQERFKRNPDKL